VERQATAVACGHLISVLINGIDRRFDAVFDDKEATAAAILHPKFRTTWTDSERLIETGITHIRNLLAASASAATASTSRQLTGTSVTSAVALRDDDVDDDELFFKRRIASNPSSSVDVLAQYLQSTSEETAYLSTWPELKRLFVRLNTPLPASAASERLFSCAGIVMNSRRTRMSDSLFEELVGLKQNKAVVQ